MRDDKPKVRQAITVHLRPHSNTDGRVRVEEMKEMVGLSFRTDGSPADHSISMTQEEALILANNLRRVVGFVRRRLKADQ